MKRRLLVVIVAGLALVGTACSSGGSSSGASGASSGEGSHGAAVSAAFTRADGSSGSFADYLGTPVVVNFFSSTCVPCVAEMPALESVNQALGGAVRFVGVDPQDTAEGARSFAEAEKVSWDIAIDADASLASRFGAVALPTTVVLDRAGVKVFTHQGAMTADQLRAALRDHGLGA